MRMGRILQDVEEIGLVRVFTEVFILLDAFLHQLFLYLLIVYLESLFHFLEFFLMPASFLLFLKQVDVLSLLIQLLPENR